MKRTEGIGYGIVRGGEIGKWSKKRRRMKRVIKKRRRMKRVIKKRRLLLDPFGVRGLSKSNNTVVTHV
jgi:hypothetical protein